MLKILITGGNGNIAGMIKRNLSHKYDITALSRKELDLMKFDEVKSFLSNKSFDVCIHTAIKGGRRTIAEGDNTVYVNLLMFENLMKFSHVFRMIINLDSGAIYDRSTDILNRLEFRLNTVPSDYYGFSKYLIHKISKNTNVFHLRIFNIFHIREEPDRFIAMCFHSKYNKTPLTIFDDKYFDFVYEDDFIKIVDFYIENIDTNNLYDTVNISYKEKYKLSDIAKMIIEDETLIKVENSNCDKNYTGDSMRLESYEILMDGMEKSLEKYNLEYNKYKSNSQKNINNKCDSIRDIYISNRFCKIT
jgi:GDP-L-fucose synthase